MAERENFYIGEVVETSYDEKKLILITYDIIDNKRRSKFFKFLSGYMTPVQKSCFESHLTDKEFDRLRKKFIFISILQRTMCVAINYRPSAKSITLASIEEVASKKLSSSSRWLKIAIGKLFGSLVHRKDRKKRLRPQRHLLMEQERPVRETGRTKKEPP